MGALSVALGASNSAVGVLGVTTAAVAAGVSAGADTVTDVCSDTGAGAGVGVGAPEGVAVDTDSTRESEGAATEVAATTADAADAAPEEAVDATPAGAADAAKVEGAAAEGAAVAVGSSAAAEELAGTVTVAAVLVRESAETDGVALEREAAAAVLAAGFKPVPGRVSGAAAACCVSLTTAAVCTLATAAAGLAAAFTPVLERVSGDGTACCCELRRAAAAAGAVGLLLRGSPKRNGALDRSASAPDLGDTMASAPDLGDTIAAAAGALASVDDGVTAAGAFCTVAAERVGEVGGGVDGTIIRCGDVNAGVRMGAAGSGFMLTALPVLNAARGVLVAACVTCADAPGTVLAVDTGGFLMIYVQKHKYTWKCNKYCKIHKH